MCNDSCERTFLLRPAAAFVRASRLSCLSAAVLSLAMALSGCASDPQHSYYERDAAIPAATASGLPEQGASVCLSSTARSASTLEVFLRRAIADRGYRVVMLNPGESAISDVCRFHVIFSTDGDVRSGELPRAITRDFRDFYTGESQHADWRRADTHPSFMRTTADQGASMLIAGPYGDPAMIIRNLVDQLFPTPAAALH